MSSPHKVPSFSATGFSTLAAPLSCVAGCDSVCLSTALLVWPLAELSVAEPDWACAGTLQHPCLARACDRCSSTLNLAELRA